MQVVEIAQGASPVILGMPHTGTAVPPEVWRRLNDRGKELTDTDWHIHRLYDELLPGATTVKATFHRYVIDANRDPAGVSLYPGQNSTDLIPKTDFDGRSIWEVGQEPGPDDMEERVKTFHAPYHQALCAEIARVKALHGIAVLYDCHSIRSRIPFLFEGKLPDLNIGTNTGRSCGPAFEAAAELAAKSAVGSYDYVVNGRFKGGWTTRQHGRPNEGVHAIQIELAQSTYLQTESAPFAYDEAKAEKLRLHIRALLEQIETIASQIKEGKEGRAQ